MTAALSPVRGLVARTRWRTADKAGKYRFRLKASNGQVVAASQAYESKASALNGIESVKTSSVDAPTIEVAGEE